MVGRVWLVSLTRGRIGKRMPWSLRCHSLGILLSLPFVPSCKECTEEGVYGLTVRVVDDTTQEPVCDATVTAVEGNHSETLSHLGSPDCRYVGALERPGAYHLTASREGYLLGSADGVTVSDGECHVDPEVRTIALKPGKQECSPGDLFGCVCPSGGQGTQSCSPEGKLQPCGC